jgi:hypothetical protein
MFLGLWQEELRFVSANGLRHDDFDDVDERGPAEP